MSYYVIWFIRYVKVTYNHARILCFFDMDNGGLKILHQLSSPSSGMNPIPEFEDRVKYPTEWVGLRPTYLHHLTAHQLHQTQYGIGSGLNSQDAANLMTCTQECKQKLMAWLDKYNNLQANPLLSNSVSLANASKRISEIQWMYSNGISSLASVPVANVIADMQALIDQAI